MFTIGEFSILAQVSKRLLRYYDEIGLLKPNHSEKFTGYRYYSAAQLPRLNRILALKELGLSLDQIQRLLSDKVSTEEMQGMLLLAKAESERNIQAQHKRIQNIESRLQLIRTLEANQPLDVVLKQIPSQRVLSVRTSLESNEEALALFAQIVSALPDQSAYGPFFGIVHNDGVDEPNLEVEMGRLLKVKNHVRVPLAGNLQLEVSELNAVVIMATFVVKGSTENLHIGYSAIGTWAEANGYQLAGPPREIALELSHEADGSDAITEIQFPLEALRES